ncbi:MAG: pectinesterase family protein [Spirochaetales bacterium]|nr:pectinesterase family protein [Spirochaetales bacterium]
MENTVLKVDKNDSGAFNTVSEALGAANAYWGLPVEIRLAPGQYRERLVISQPLISLVGDQSTETIITFDDAALDILPDGRKRGTFRTATVLVEGSGFRARNITFQNSAGSGESAGQCIALYVDTDKAGFENCRFLGAQDTLFLAPLPLQEMEKGGFRGPKEFTPRLMGHHHFQNCFIEGDVDFIFGGAAALFENCEIHSLDKDKEINGYITAPCTPESEEQGFVFYRCRFTGSCAPGTVYLGRPWRHYARVVIVECELGPHIHPAGFHDWDKTDSHNTSCFAEFGSRGEGAAGRERAAFVQQFDEDRASAVMEKIRRLCTF